MTGVPKPASPLPWKQAEHDKAGVGPYYGADGKIVSFTENHPYVAHAANAYPVMVAALRAVATGRASMPDLFAANLLKQLSEPLGC